MEGFEFRGGAALLPGLAARIHISLVAVAALLFPWFLSNWKLLGPDG
ncbi:MAG TPA: hypothetical protein VFA45_22630 [Actinomycetes bacterium]|jgi:hypothetical protein|nr:hypothetical protein [Actinomycetes bacterium]